VGVHVVFTGLQWAPDAVELQTFLQSTSSRGRWCHPTVAGKALLNYTSFKKKTSSQIFLAALTAKFSSS
jgi:hypothetical protein